MRDWPPCPPIQRDGGRRSRPGANPFISVLTVARCPAIFPGVWPQLRDTLSTSQSVGRRTGAFIYALSAVENRPALAAPRHTSTALFSCRFKCPCPPRRQRHFHGNADRAYNTLHFASQSRVPKGGVAPFGNPHKKRRYATPPRVAYRLFLLSSPPAVSVEQKPAWDWCGIFNFGKPRGAFVKDIYRLQVISFQRHICARTPVWRQKRRRGLIKKDCFGPLLQTLRCSRNSSTSKADSFLFVL